jgi:hypothetical protein
MDPADRCGAVDLSEVQIAVLESSAARQETKTPAAVTWAITRRIHDARASGITRGHRRPHCQHSQDAIPSASRAKMGAP